MMIVTFLEADVPLTKTFTKVGQTITAEPYPYCRDFSSYEVEVASISEFALVLQEQANERRCLLKGGVGKPLVNESRAGSTNPNEETKYLCLDLDFSEGFDRDITKFLAAIGIEDTQAVWQKSASAGVKYSGDGLRGHCFVELHEPVNPHMIKTWLKDLNLRVPELRALTALTATKRSLQWPLDITTCQNDKLIYIAPPLILQDGVDCPDPLDGERIFDVPGTHETWVFPKDFRNAGEIQRDEATRIAELREAEGLPKEKAKFKVFGGEDVLQNPNPSAVTGMRTARGYTYLNLNHGDSWGYYYPEDKPTIVYNFKGEPPVMLKALCLDFWKKQQPETLHEQGVEAYTFIDRSQTKYYTCLHNRATKQIELTKVAGKEFAQNFRGLYGLELSASYQIWDIEFAPTTIKQIDVENKWVNTYRPSVYNAIEANPALNLEDMPTIKRIIHNVVANDKECIDGLLNWLAYAWQFKKKSGIAWLLHGVEGTGKGVLFHRIITPLFGERYCIAITDDALREKYNAYREQKLFVLLDEINLSANSQKNSDCNANNKLKSLVTEDSASIRAMYADPTATTLFDNVLLASNDKTPINISPSDRRFTVPPRAEAKLHLTEEDVERTLPKELENFAGFLKAYKVDDKAARLPIINAARAHLIEQAVNSTDIYLDALCKGSIEPFIEDLLQKEKNAEGVLVQPTGLDNPNYIRFDQIVRQWHEEASTKNTLTVSKTQITAVFNYLRGEAMSPAKRNKFLQMSNIVFTRKRDTTGDKDVNTFVFKVPAKEPPNLPESPYLKNIVTLVPATKTA